MEEDALIKQETESSLRRRGISGFSVSSGRWPEFLGVSLEGSRTSVEQVVAEQDAEQAFMAATGGPRSQDIWTYMPYGPFERVSEIYDWLESCESSTDPLFLVFRDKTSRQLGGMGSYLRIRPHAGAVEIGHIWFSRMWQRGFRATEALSLIMHHAMEGRRYRRLEWKCNALNLTSRAAALRLGFRFEGIFLNHMVVKSQNRDTAWYSITDSEWPAVREAHAAWLAKENFREDGSQRMSLRDRTRALWQERVKTSVNVQTLPS